MAALPACECSAEPPEDRLAFHLGLWSSAEDCWPLCLKVRQTGRKGWHRLRLLGRSAQGCFPSCWGFDTEKQRGPKQAGSSITGPWVE